MKEAQSKRAAGEGQASIAEAVAAGKERGVTKAEGKERGVTKAEAKEPKVGVWKNPVRPAVGEGGDQLYWDEVGLGAGGGVYDGVGRGGGGAGLG